MDSNSDGTHALQFDTAVPVLSAEVSTPEHGVTCVGCQRMVLDHYFDVNGQCVCEACRDQVSRQAETPRGWGVFARACLSGFVAAVLGAILYYAVIAITNLEIGIVAIAIGYMVGYGIRMATTGRGGRRFQIVALLLTYWAVGLAYTPLVFSEMSKGGAEERTNATAAPSARDAEESGDISLPVAIAVLVGLSFALPVITVVSSLPGGLISAAIIAFGMQQAWRMTATPVLQITGPFRIAAAPPVAT